MYNNYIPTDKHMKSIFGADDPICMSGPELHTYAKEHDLLLGLLRIQFRIATEEDIAHWGVKGVSGCSQNGQMSALVICAAAWGSITSLHTGGRRIPSPSRNMSV